MSNCTIVGIAGGTGAGKTTIARMLCERLPDDAVTVIEHDAYYKDREDLTFDERAALNYDHPNSLDNELFCKHIEALRDGQAIERPVYDFLTHRRKPETDTLESRPVVIVEGILIFVERRLRDLMDIKLFVDTDSDIRVLRRIRRDIEHRGRDFESVRKQYRKTVRPMHLEFVEPNKRYADLIIPEGHGGDLAIALDVLFERLARAARTGG